MENNFSLISDKINTFFRDKKLCSGSKIPTSGEYKVGDFIVSDTQTDGVFGWVCVKEGNPGTWETLYLNGSGTSEEVDLSNYVTKDEIGELTNLETDSKENIVAAVNELDREVGTVNTLANQALEKANEAFQRGDKVKTQLVDKLISEGSDVSTDNSFEELIGNITLGKKWATGTFDRQNIVREIIGGDRTVFFVDINNLSFEPSIVIIHTDFDGSRSSVDNIIIYNKSVSATKFYSGDTAGNVGNFYGINVPINSSFPTWYRGLIKSNGFKFQVGFEFNTTATSINISEHTWIAFE